MDAHRRRHGEALKWLLAQRSCETSECLLWPFNRNNHGYGCLTAWGTRQLAHRLMCEFANGPAPNDRPEAAHSCGNGHLGCCNPKHLRWATIAENEQDKLLHGTDNRGERNGQAKLTATEVREIRRLAGSNTHERLAELFGVSRFLISLIVRRRRWSWLT